MDALPFAPDHYCRHGWKLSPDGISLGPAITADYTTSEGSILHHALTDVVCITQYFYRYKYAANGAASGRTEVKDERADMRFARFSSQSSVISSGRSIHGL